MSRIIYTSEDYKDITMALEELLRPYGGTMWHVAEENRHKLLHGLPHRLSVPFYLLPTEQRTLRKFGKLLLAFLQASFELYHEDPKFQTLVHWGKPPYMQKWDKIDIVCFRVDYGVTPHGLMVYEFGFNLNGIPMQIVIDEAYLACGKEIAISPAKTKEALRSRFYTGGKVVYTNPAYGTQYKYFAEKVLTAEGQPWDAMLLSDNCKLDPKVPIWRAFQEHEAADNLLIGKLSKGNYKIFPSLLQNAETKLHMGALEEFREYYSAKLGEDNYDTLTSHIPTTIVVNITPIDKLVELMEQNQLTVLKVVDGPLGYGCKGVKFLHDMPEEDRKKELQNAKEDLNYLWILQRFDRAWARKHDYPASDWSITNMRARSIVRALYDGHTGELLNASAISSPGGDKIHGRLDSIWAPLAPFTC